MSRIQIIDPESNREMVLYSARGESNEVWRADLDSAAYCLMREYNWDESEVIAQLIHSNADNPITYRDQIFWLE